MDLDERFSRIYKDPRFKKVPRKFRKVRIDSRFKSMFTDKRFQTKYSIDKRGRPLKQTSSDDLEKFYDLSGDSSSDDDDAVQKIGEDRNVAKPSRVKETDSIKESKGQTSLLPEKAQSNETKPNDELDGDKSTSEGEPDDIDDIRGLRQALQQSESSDAQTDDEKDDNDSDDPGLAHDWGELDKDARRQEDAETSRLAICNLDWDRVGANDLYMLFNSFVPSGGSIKSIKIYESDYGLQRMKEEDTSGPKELKEIALEEGDHSDSENVEGSEYHMEKLRQYQLQRFKYYYAVMECDCTETANKIYEECDNQEFELSATRLDLRFIPEETTFDREPVSQVSGGSVLENYKPSDFSSTALQQSRVKLTWDESDPRRTQLMTKAFSKEEIENMDVQAYLASSSDDEADVAYGLDGNEGQETAKTNDDEDSRINKYRALMKEIEEKEKKSDDDQDMEISWTPGLGDGLTASNTKEKDKKKAKKTKMESVPSEDEGEEEELEVESADSLGKASNDEDDSAADDDTWTASLRGKDAERDTQAGEAAISKRKGKRKKKGQALTEEEKEAQQKSKEELELLLMDDQEEKKHFNLKAILEKEKKSKRKKKGKRKAGETDDTEDSFKLDVEDKRFDALFSSHLFALDPSDSHFRKTTATDAIIKEKQRRKEIPVVKKSASEDVQPVTPAVTKAMDPSLSSLIKSVKSRTIKHKESRAGKALRSKVR